jgi:hypothetical protein
MSDIGNSNVGLVVKYHRDGHVQVEVGSHLSFYKQDRLVACERHSVSLLQPARHLKIYRRPFPQEARPLWMLLRQLLVTSVDRLLQGAKKIVL